MTQTANATPAGNGSVEICKSANNGMQGAGPFEFTLTDPQTGAVLHAPVMVTGGDCTNALAVRGGPVRITETTTNLPAGDKVVAIKVNPSWRTVWGTKSLANRTVIVRAPAGASETMVTFVNKVPPGILKVCKYSTTKSLQGIGYSFTINSGSPVTIKSGSSEATANCTFPRYFKVGTQVPVVEQGIPNGLYHVASITKSGSSTLSSDPATGSTTVTIGSGTTLVYYDNEPNPAPQTGEIKVCKDGWDGYVTGTFNFKVTDASGKTQSASATVGQCSNVLTVTAGNVTVTETARSPYYLKDVHMDYLSPAGSVVSQNDTNRSAVISVPVDQTANHSDVAVVDFVNATTMEPLEVCKAITSTSGDLAGQSFTLNLSENLASTGGGTQTDSVNLQAGSAGSSVCSNPIGLPLGTVVTVSEASPGSAANGAAYQAISGNGAKLTLGTGDNTATVTNQAMGTLKVCKVMAAGFEPKTPPNFPFTVTAGGTSTDITVQPGTCSSVMTVPAGTATVTENPVTGYHLVGVTGGTLPAGSTTATTDVSATGPTSVLTFTNAVNTASFEVCKYVTSGSGTTLNNVTFNFTWSDATGQKGSASLLPGQCSLPVTLPVLQGNGSANQVMVTETGSSPTTQPWYLASIGVAGSGSQVSQNLAGRSNVITLGMAGGGDTQDNFTNAAGTSPGV